VASRVQLKEWSAGTLGTGGALRLSGRVAGHPMKADGTAVVTSPVVHTDGRLCFTASGNIYELVGEPEPEYLVFLSSIRKTYDPKQPVKVVRRG
jgi:hypothetical protein